MKDLFFELATFAFGRLRGAEVLLANFSGEVSDFIRVNHALVRQPMTVRQSYLTLQLIDGRWHDRTTLTITGNGDEDRAWRERRDRCDARRTAGAARGPLPSLQLDRGYIDPALDRYTAILFGEDPMSPHLFMRDPDLAWTLRPSTTVRFLGTDVTTNGAGWRGAEIPERGTKILCLGDSTTFGWRVKATEPFPARLQSLLAARGPEGEVPIVIGAGVPGYSSLQVRRLAEKAIPRWRPAVVVLCTGNNDGWPSAESDAAYFRRTRAAAAAERVAAHSRWLVWLRNRLVPDPESVPVADVLAPGQAPRVSREAFLDK